MTAGHSDKSGQRETNEGSPATQHSQTLPMITEEIAAEMIAGGYEFELPPIPCTIRLRDVLERMTDAELALQPGEIADQERERCRRKPCSTS